MNKTFTIDNRTFKQVPAVKGCEGCAGSFSSIVCEDGKTISNKDMCIKISEYVSERKFKSCTGQGVIYVEVKK